MKKNDMSSKSFSKSTLVPFLSHVIIGVLACLLLSLIFSTLIISEIVDESSVIPFACIAVFSGAFLSGILTAKKFGKTLLSALSQGIFFFLILYLSGAILFSRLIPAESSPAVILACFSGALCAAIFAALTGRKHRL